MNSFMLFLAYVSYDIFLRTQNDRFKRQTINEEKGMKVADKTLSKGEITCVIAIMHHCKGCDMKAALPDGASEGSFGGHAQHCCGCRLSCGNV
jgi:hypothetical protein